MEGSGAPALQSRITPLPLCLREMPPRQGGGMSPAVKQAIHTKRKRKAIDELEAMYGESQKPAAPAERQQRQRTDRDGGARPPPPSPWTGGDRSAQEGTGIYQVLPQGATAAAAAAPGLDVEEFIYSLIKQVRRVPHVFPAHSFDHTKPMCPRGAERQERGQGEAASEELAA